MSTNGQYFLKLKKKKMLNKFYFYKFPNLFNTDSIVNQHAMVTALLRGQI